MSPTASETAPRDPTVVAQNLADAFLIAVGDRRRSQAMKLVAAESGPSATYAHFAGIQGPSALRAGSSTCNEHYCAVPFQDGWDGAPDVIVRIAPGAPAVIGGYSARDDQSFWATYQGGSAAYVCTKRVTHLGDLSGAAIPAGTLLTRGYYSRPDDDNSASTGRSPVDWGGKFQFTLPKTDLVRVPASKQTTSSAQAWCSTHV
jgi:hypothetical protein